MPLAEPLHDGKTLGDLGYSKLKVIYAFALAKAEITVSGCVVNNGTGTTYQEQVAVKIQDLLYGGTLIPDHDKRESLRADVLDHIQQYFKTGILPKITPGEVGCVCLPVVLVTAVMSRPHVPWPLRSMLLRFRWRFVRRHRRPFASCCAAVHPVQHVLRCAMIDTAGSWGTLYSLRTCLRM